MHFKQPPPLDEEQAAPAYTDRSAMASSVPTAAALQTLASSSSTPRSTMRNLYVRGMTPSTTLPPPVQLMDRIDLARAVPALAPRQNTPDDALVEDEAQLLLWGEGCPDSESI